MLEKRNGEELPPTVDDILAWSAIFRCKGTFKNYLNHVRVACELLRLPTAVFDNREVKRAGMAIQKRRMFIPRAPLFLGHDKLVQIMNLAIADGDKSEAMLYLACYVFLLRMPSEALPMVKGCGGAYHGEQSTLFMGIGCIYLKLATRKNKPSGSILRRFCWCHQDRSTCPVHVLGAYLESLAKGCKLFGGFNPGIVLAKLRGRLQKLGVPKAWDYRAHDFRRGHADDLRRAGKSLKEILQAGEWRSPAFLQYLDLADLEFDLVVSAHIDESSGDER